MGDKTEIMETIDELEKYLEENCYSFCGLSIGKHRAPEGIVIERSDDKYQFAYEERGRREVIKSFSDEKDLVSYALKELKDDEWARAHLVAWVWDEAEIKEAEKELKRRNICFKRNDIPNYSAGKCAYRIFVFGRDVLRLSKFKKRFWRYNRNETQV